MSLIEIYVKEFLPDSEKCPLSHLLMGMKFYKKDINWNKEKKTLMISFKDCWRKINDDGIKERIQLTFKNVESVAIKCPKRFEEGFENNIVYAGEECGLLVRNYGEIILEGLLPKHYLLDVYIKVNAIDIKFIIESEN